MNKMKIILIFLCVIVCCKTLHCQTMLRQTFPPDTTLEICKIKDTDFSCQIISWETPKIYRFILERKENTAEVIFIRDGNHYELCAYQLNRNLCIDDSLKEETIKIPYIDCLFYRNILSHTFSDLKKVSDQTYKVFEDPDYEVTDGSCQNNFSFKKEYTYLEKDYSIEKDYSQRQLIGIGRKSCLFSTSSDLELNYGMPYGEWRILKDTIIQSTENLRDSTICQLKNYNWDFVNEVNLPDGTLKWDMTTSELKCLFIPNKDESFYFKVDINAHPYMSEIIQHDAPTERKIVHVFSSNGDISQIVCADKTESFIFNYDEKGDLSSKISMKNLNSREIIKETFDIDKEYESIVMQPEE